jgi:hypothetical protein
MIDKIIELKLIKILKKYNRETDDDYDNLKQFYSEGLSGESFNKVFKERLKLRVCEKGEIMNEDFEKMCSEAYTLGNGKQTRLLECVKLAIEDRKMILLGKDELDEDGDDILKNESTLDQEDQDSDDGDQEDEDMSIEDRILINQTKFKKINNAQYQKDVAELFANADDRLRHRDGTFLTWEEEIALFWEGEDSIRYTTGEFLTIGEDIKND